MKLPKIKPCPFCWSKARIYTETSHSGDFGDIDYYDVECTNPKCYMGSGGAEWQFTTKLKAIKKWNYREQESEIKIKLIRSKKKLKREK